MKLNPEKCTFNVPTGQILGYIVSQRGIEANPSKIKAIEALEPPNELRDVQKFAGYSHLWTATQEQRDWRHSSREASSATTSQMGSVLTN
jgi:hypothetical protein